MRKVAGLALATLAHGACLYDVEDVRSHPSDAGLGGQAGGDVGAGGWPVGGASGAGGVVADAELEAGVDAAGGGANDAAPDAPPTTWSSCRDLGYAGTCLGDTVIFFDNGTTYPGCWVNDCPLKGGVCKKITGGWGCSYQLDTNQVGNCKKWNTGQCHGNAAIKADPSDPKDCLYKDCTPLGKTCEKPDGGLADCQ